MIINLDFKHKQCLIHAGPTVGKSTLDFLTKLVPDLHILETDAVYKDCIPELRALRPWRAGAKLSKTETVTVEANELFNRFCVAAFEFVLGDRVADDALELTSDLASLIRESVAMAKAAPLSDETLTYRLGVLARLRSDRLSAEYYYVLTNRYKLGVSGKTLPSIMGRQKFDITIWPSSAELMHLRSRRRDGKEGIPLSLCMKWTSDYLANREEMADIRVLVGEGEYLFDVLTHVGFVTLTVSR